MVFGYVGCGNMGIAKSLFDSMPERDVVSWNTLISGYLQNGDYREAIDVFVKMQKMGMVFDRTTFAVF
jgi:pentatricopeptide repeat protein